MITADTALLTGVIFCGTCGGPMYRTKSKRKRKDGTVRTWFYYRCGGKDRRRSNCRNMIRCELLDGLTHAAFCTHEQLMEAHEAAGVDVYEANRAAVEALGEGGRLTEGARIYRIFSNLIVFEQVVIEGSDHADEIADVEGRLHDLDFDAADYIQRHAQLLAERKRLQGLPVEPTRVEERPTGKTVADVWASLDHAGQRRYLLATGMRVIVTDKHTARMDGDPTKIAQALRTIAA
jgi:hypothetical protein